MEVLIPFITASIIDYYYSHNTNEKKAQKDSTLLN